VNGVDEIIHHCAAGTSGTHFNPHGISNWPIKEEWESFDPPDLSENKFEVLYVLLRQNAG